MSSPPFCPVTALPEVPLDKVITYLDAEDLRTFHRVSRAWKAALESRKKDNDRRLELVRCIQENKENLANGATIQEAVPAASDHRAAARERTADDKKNGADHYLMECTNLVQQSTPVMSKLTTPDSSVFLTPISPFEFQKFEEAEKSLERGQKLYQCGRCRGPVPSPVVSGEPKESRRPRRCKLISIMNLPDEHHSDIQQQERKKVKTLSTVPPALSSPTTIALANLGEKMTQSLVLSSPSLSMFSGSHLGLNQWGTPDKDIRRSTSCSSITGIDLGSSMSRGPSPINLSLDLSMGNLNTSGNQFYMPTLDFNYSRLSCSRSCCRQDIHNSLFSDSSVSFGSESNMTTEFCEFANMIPSPVPVSSDFNNSQLNIERGRNIQDYSHSNGAMSSSSFSFQHSVPNSEGSIVLECPQPSCGFRFCSNCEESEHSGRPCHVLSADHMESFSEDSALGVSSSFNSNKTKRLDAERSKETSLKKTKSRTKSHKSSLRRIARLPS